MKQATLLLLLFFLMSCSKEAMQRNAIMEAMTQGKWSVVIFKKGTTDVTTSFVDYAFQFKDNYTVTAFHNSLIEKTGTWTADVNAKTITSTFTNASDPLILLNGTWQITDNDWTRVDASQTINGETRILRLEKH